MIFYFVDYINRATSHKTQENTNEQRLYKLNIRETRKIYNLQFSFHRSACLNNDTQK